MLRFHGILLPQRRTLEWKDNTSEASSFCSWGKTKTHALMHIPSHKQGFVCADEERLSSPHQSCCAPWSTCCMQSRSQQSNTVPLLCSGALLMCREPTAPADSRQVTDRDNSQVSGRHAVSHEHGHVWHSASITTGASLALIYTFTHPHLHLYNVCGKVSRGGDGAWSKSELSGSGSNSLRYSRPAYFLYSSSKALL